MVKPSSRYVVVFADNSAIVVKSAEFEVVARSITNLFSLVELSTHVREMEVSAFDVAVKLDGAIGPCVCYRYTIGPSGDISCASGSNSIGIFYPEYISLLSVYVVAFAAVVVIVVKEDPPTSAVFRILFRSNCISPC
jgi:predicted GH43/DUF377 family glycosyl hydrolase